MSFVERLRLAILFWFVLTIVVGQAVVLAVWLAERLGKDVSRSQFAQPRVRLAFTSLSFCWSFVPFTQPSLNLTGLKLPK